MTRSILLVALSTTLHAATYTVCWNTNSSQQTFCGDPMGRKAADTFVEQANRNFPDIHYWVTAGSNTTSNWNRARWASLGAALAAGFFDAHTTSQAIAGGAVEKNFLYGSHPSAARLYGIDIGSIAGEFLFVEWLRSRHPESAGTIDRNSFFAQLGVAGVHVAAAVHNESVINEEKSPGGN